MEVKEKKVVIAMSGGVDSSVAASLLVEQGYAVTGMMLKLWSDECQEAENACCPPEAINQARQVANIIGIPFYVLDVRDLFKQLVVDTFIDSLNLGLTPNPCYLCNQNVRWGVFLNRVLDSGYEYFSTGHYARVGFDGKYYQLKKGLDPLKDQSYVLSGLNQNQLSHTIFPLGELTKTKVRELAHQLNLPVAEKHDSQDLCFVGKAGYRDFLKRHSKGENLPGNILNHNGVIVGKHDGLSNYTIGQRKGLGAGNAEPVYVLEKNIFTNEIIIGSLDQLGKDHFSVTQLNWITGEMPNSELDCLVKIRYKAKLVQAHASQIQGNTAAVDVDRPLRDITPGQIAVFYQGDTVLGSGMIKSVNNRGGN
jgi:tRNA-uridine 2-sulfurtransferase